MCIRDSTTTTTTATLFNANATTVNIGSAATTVSIGSTGHTGTTSIQNDLYVYGSITFGSGASTLSATTIQIDDTLISLADNNTADILDIGFYAGYQPASTPLHTGLVRDASDSVWKLFSGVSTQPTTTVNFTGATYDALKIGALTATSATLAGDLLFTDATYDIGKSGATRPRDVFLSRNLTIGGTTSFGGNIISDVLFTDNTYDIGKSGATRPRNLFLAGNAVITGTTTHTGNIISDLLFTDATYDIGKSGATRPRDLFLSRDLTTGGTITVNGGAGGAAVLLKSGGDLQLFTADNLGNVSVYCDANGVLSSNSATVLLSSGGATLTGGVRFTPFNLGNTSAATITPNPLNGNYQYATNNGTPTAFNAPTVDCAIDILLSNTTGATAFSFTGYTVVSTSYGDALTTATTARFIISIRRINSIATYNIKQIAL
jgi:hypothetical protein